LPTQADKVPTGAFTRERCNCRIKQKLCNAAHTALEKKFTLNEIEVSLEGLEYDGWVQTDSGKIGLTPRGHIELRPYFTAD